jgi:hypothetical protein
MSFNAMTLPICALMAYSLGCVGYCLLRRRTLRIPRWTAWAWMIVLLVGWLLKLTGDPAYW